MCGSERFQKSIPESGKIEIPFTNDYLVKMFLQKNEQALRSLISAVLHIDPSEIRSLIVENPITPGETITEKGYILDIKVNFNNDTVIDIEMQVIDHEDWPERSMQYLCRSFDMLNKGQNYLETKTAIQIGLLDYPLFGENDKFSSSFRMMDIDTHRIYTDKFQLYTVCLPFHAQASAADIEYGTRDWARFLRAKTWEEVKEMAETNTVFRDSAKTICELMSDPRERERIEAREDYNRRMRTIEIRLKRAEEIERRSEEIERRSEEIERRSEKIERLKEEAERRKEEAERRIEEAERRKEELEHQKKNAERQAEEEYQRRIKAEKELESLRKQLKEIQFGNTRGIMTQD